MYVNNLPSVITCKCRKGLELGVEPATSWSRVQRPKPLTTTPPCITSIYEYEAWLEDEIYVLIKNAYQMKSVQDLGHDQHATNGIVCVQSVLFFALLADLLVQHLLPQASLVVVSLPQRLASQSYGNILSVFVWVTLTYYNDIIKLVKMFKNAALETVAKSELSLFPQWQPLFCVLFDSYFVVSTSAIDWLERLVCL